MAVAYRSSSTAATGASGGTSLSISAPTGVANGDILLIVVATDFQSSLGTYTVTAPAGWSALTGQVNVTAPAALASFETTLWTFWKQAGSSEPSSYSFTISDGHGTAATAAASLAAFSGAAQTFTGVVTSTTANTGSSLAASGVTGALASDMIVILGGGQDQAKQSTNSMSITGPGSPWTSVATASASASYEKAPCVACVAYQTGVTTGGTFSFSGNQAGAYVQTIFSKVGQNTGNTTFLFTPTGNATAGNTLVLTVTTRTPTAGTTITVTDTKSNTWTVDTYQVSNNDFVAIASTRMNGGALTTSDQVTITFNNAWSGSGCNVNCDEFYGLLSASYTDGTAQSNSSGSSSANAGSITPTVNGDLMIAMITWNGNGTITGNVSGTVGSYVTTAFAQPNGTNPKSSIYGYQFVSGGSGVAQQFNATLPTSNAYQGASVAYKANGAYNMGAAAVAINLNATLIAAADTATAVDAVTTIGVGDFDVFVGSENAVVVAQIGGAADSFSGADSGTSVVPIGGGDTATFVDTAVVSAKVPAADSFTGVEVFQILSGGATLAFGQDFASFADSGASQPASGQLVDSGTFFDSATIAIQGPIPSGYQRIVYVLPEMDISE